MRQEDGSIGLKQKAKRLGSLKDYPLKSQITPVYTGYMQRVNAGKFMPEASMTLKQLVDEIYLGYIEEKRASTKKGYAEIWKNHICDRVGYIQVREFRTVHASRMLRAIADENDLSKTRYSTSKPCSAAFSLMLRMKVRSTAQTRSQVAECSLTRGSQEKPMHTTWPKFVEF